MLAPPMRATWVSCGAGPCGRLRRCFATFPPKRVRASAAHVRHQTFSESAAERSPAQIASPGSAPLAGAEAPTPNSAAHGTSCGVRRVRGVSGLAPVRRAASSRLPHPRISAQGFVAAKPAPRPARSSRCVRRTAFLRLTPLGTKPPLPAPHAPFFALRFPLPSLTPLKSLTSLQRIKERQLSSFRHAISSPSSLFWKPPLHDLLCNRFSFF